MAQFYSDDGKENQGHENLWKKCIWKRKTDGAACMIQAINEWDIETEHCDSSLGAVRIAGGERKKCEIDIPNTKLNDKGTWTCTMEKCADESMGGCAYKDSGDCKGEDQVYIEVNNPSRQNFTQDSSYYSDL